MVLLRGKNYDYSGEITANIKANCNKATTTLQVSSTIGLSVDDFIVINPRSIYAEIVQITAIVASSTLTVTALKFNHIVDDSIFKIAFNKMKFYTCDTATGTYVLITSSETEMNYTDNQTNLNHPTGTSSQYFKRTFYNSETTVESDIDLADYWQTSNEEVIITEQEMRSFLQFELDDWPTPSDVKFFITLGVKKLTLDVDTSDDNILFIAALLISKSYILRALATKSISKGYIQVNAEGRVITKAYQEIVLEAERVLQEYKEFIVANGRREATSTKYMNDTANISSWTRQEIIDIMNGTTNAENAEMSRKYSYFWGRR